MRKKAPLASAQQVFLPDHEAVIITANKGLVEDCVRIRVRSRPFGDVNARLVAGHGQSLEGYATGIVELLGEIGETAQRWRACSFS